MKVHYLLLIFLLLLLYPHHLVSQYTRTSTQTWTTSNNPPQILPKIQLDQYGVVINSKDGFFKKSFNLTSNIYSINQTGFLTSAVDSKTNEVYSVAQLGNGTSLRFVDIRKYDAFGSSIWNTTFDIEENFFVNGSLSYCTSIAAIVDMNSQLVIVQYFQSVGLFYIARFFSDGSVEVAAQVEGLNNLIWQLAVDSDNNLYMACYSTADGMVLYCYAKSCY